MKKITINVFVIMFMLGTFVGVSQTLNQPANWPNAGWTLSGTYNPVGLSSDPTGAGTTFTFDDDAAGSGNVDMVMVTSPVIDLTAASGAGETWITVSGNFTYRALGGDILAIEVYDADAMTWSQLYQFAGNTTTTSDYQNCTISEAYSTPVLDISGFTPAQLSGFQYRVSYDDVGGWQYGFCVESPTITSAAPPVCLEPTMLALDSVTDTDAVVSWTNDPGATLGVEFEFGAAGFTPGTGTSVAAGGGIGTAADAGAVLMPETAYDFYVRSNCDANGFSNWAGPVSFTTTCVPIAAPYTEDFETFTTGTSAFIAENCWSANANGTSFWESAPGTDTGSGGTGPDPSITTGNYFYTEVSGSTQGDEANLISRPVDLTPLTTPSLSFDYHMFGSVTGTLNVLVNGTDNVWSLSGQQQTSATESWITAFIDLSAYAGQSISITFNAISGGSYEGDIAIDNVVFDEAPTCFVDAGTITADESLVQLNGVTTISATPDGNIVLQPNYDVTYVLTSGAGLVIEQAGATPSFDVTVSGDYTIHTLVAETSDNTDPNFLDLSVIVFGTTTAQDVIDIVTNNSLCASLDTAGAPITVADCIADAGTLTADSSQVVLNGTTTISATPNGDIVVPTDYEVTYVLTSGAGLVIEQAGATPSFDVTVAGDYTIHTLVAETSDNTSPDFLDLSVIQFGVTTGVDVLDIITNNSLCASLDVAGAPVQVIDPATLPELLLVDLLTTNEVTVSATSGLSAATVSGPDGTGIYLADFFVNAGTQTLTNNLVTGDLTSATETSDGSPSLFRGGSGADTGLNIWSYATETTSNFTAGQLAFTGQGNWTLSVDEYNAFLTAPATGIIYFPADTSDDIAGGATIIGRYTVVNPLSIEEVAVNEFTYYPNPVQNTLTLNAQNNIENVAMYNMLGQEVLRATPNTMTSELDMSSLQDGTYFVKVTIANTTKTIKVIKQ